MNYEKKNKDAISTIKQALRQLATNGVPVGNMIKAIKDIEEKYAESEDERIRNFLIKQANSVLDSITDDDEEVPAWKSALAWLEKQGEQKPADKVEPRQEELTEFEKAVKQVMEEAIECGDIHNLKADADMLLKLVQKPWSEEDERIYRSIMYSFAHNFPLTILQQEFVKSLKDRYTWRPSYEQVSVLEFVMEDIEKDSIRYAVLNSVLEQLKKLMEE